MSGSGGLHSLATIIKRLEAATSRLEDLTVAQAGNTLPKREDTLNSRGVHDGYSAPPAAPPAPAPPPPPPPAPAPPAVMAETPRSVTAFDERIIEGQLKEFVELTKAFPSPVLNDQVKHVESVFKDLRTVILTASQCTKPDAKSISSLLEPLRNDVMAVLSVPEKNRKERVWANHLQVIAEGTPSVGWIEIEPKPGPHVAQMKESAEFFANRIVKEFKDKDQNQVKWARTWIALLEEQRKYVMEFHTTGLVWNPKGVSISQYSVTPASVSTASGVPLPPPPPPPPAGAPSPAAAPAGGAAAVFAQLNRGADVTKGLRKVDASEMTHKNPALRATSTVPASPAGGAAVKAPLKPSKPSSLSTKKPAKFSLDGHKWIIEYQENQSSLIVDDVNIKQTVHLFGCKNTTVQIKGKVNAISVINCTKVALLVDSVVSSIQFAKSPDMTLQVTGSAPTIMLDGCDSGQIYLSKECLSVEIVTAKCSSINVSLPVEGEEEGIFEEAPVPEMLRSTVKDGKLVTEIVEHNG